MKRIRNVKGTGDLECPCHGWLNHWRKYRFTGQALSFGAEWCAASNCNARADVGAHVEIETKSGTFIVPLCNLCNKREGWFEIDDDVSWASADKSVTCEKPNFVERFIRLFSSK